MQSISASTNTVPQYPSSLKHMPYLKSKTKKTDTSFRRQKNAYRTPIRWKRWHIKYQHSRDIRKATVDSTISSSEKK